MAHQVGETAHSRVRMWSAAAAASGRSSAAAVARGTATTARRGADTLGVRCRGPQEGRERLQARSMVGPGLKLWGLLRLSRRRGRAVWRDRWRLRTVEQRGAGQAGRFASVLCLPRRAGQARAGLPCSVMERLCEAAHGVKRRCISTEPPRGCGARLGFLPPHGRPRKLSAGAARPPCCTGLGSALWLAGWLVVQQTQTWVS